MNDVHEQHIALIEAVNNAKTREEHREADIRLRAFRDGVAAALGWNDTGRGYMLMRGDLHYIEQGIDRDTCGGVFCDWTPADSP